MRAKTRTLSPQQRTDQYAELAAALEYLTPQQTVELMARIKAGESVSGDIRARRNNHKRWEFFKRVNRWVHGTEDKELDRWAGIG